MTPSTVRVPESPPPMREIVVAASDDISSPGDIGGSRAQKRTKVGRRHCPRWTRISRSQSSCSWRPARRCAACGTACCDGDAGGAVESIFVGDGKNATGYCGRAGIGVGACACKSERARTGLGQAQCVAAVDDACEAHALAIGINGNGTRAVLDARGIIRARAGGAVLQPAAAEGDVAAVAEGTRSHAVGNPGIQDACGDGRRGGIGVRAGERQRGGGTILGDSRHIRADDRADVGG